MSIRTSIHSALEEPNFSRMAHALGKCSLRFSKLSSTHHNFNYIWKKKVILFLPWCFCSLAIQPPAKVCFRIDLARRYATVTLRITGLAREAKAPLQQGHEKSQLVSRIVDISWRRLIMACMFHWERSANIVSIRICLLMRRFLFTYSDGMRAIYATLLQ